MSRGSMAILVVLKRYIVTPITGETPYIQQDVEVVRFNGWSAIGDCLDIAQSQYPDALSFEVYRPISDSSAVPRI